VAPGNTTSTVPKQLEKQEQRGQRQDEPHHDSKQECSASSVDSHPTPVFTSFPSLLRTQGRVEVVMNPGAADRPLVGRQDPKVREIVPEAFR